MAVISLDKDNKMFQLAVDLVNQTALPIFLTGRAGTGKTTFLKYIRENCLKQIAVVAPTGVAAINAGGVTIHSMFQLPMSPYIPESKGFGQGEETVDRHDLLSRLRMTDDKRKVLQQLELLVIDEISMVRCDTIDAIDAVLRHIRQRPDQLFGGVQVLFIGDMFQLPPVCKEQEWKLLSEYYSGPYFFDSLAIRQQPPVYIEFEKIYRQKDERFIRVLNQVRNNELDQEGLDILESRFQPDFPRTNNDGYIILTTHNDRARDTNSGRLQSLNGPLFSYPADIEDDFPPGSYPADETLQLKEGAQVMFIRNDMEKGRRYFNGKIGKVIGLEKDKIRVQCNDEEPIEVKKETWENVRYNLNKDTRQLEQKTLGAFSQYPLRLAWAITIHKSQGLTFEKAIIDAGKSFAPGQVYVALSRCTSLEGMVLQSRINSSNLRSDPHIVAFSKSGLEKSQLQEVVNKARQSFIENVMLSVFDFSREKEILSELRAYYEKHAASLNEKVRPWLNALAQAVNSQYDTAVKFQVQLQRLFAATDDNQVAERTRAGANHFSNEIGHIVQAIQASPAETDSRIHAKEYNELLRELLHSITLKKHLMGSFAEGFSLDDYLLRKKNFTAPALTANAYSASSQKSGDDIPYPALYQRLRKMRDAICEKKDLAIYMVAGSQTLKDMVTYLPHTPEELGRIKGFGPVKVKSYGQDFLDIIVTYCTENNLAPKMDELPAATKKKGKKEKIPGEDKPAPPSRLKSIEPKTPRVDTKEVTRGMYNQGMTPGDIAGLRQLTLQTIQGHLAYYVQKGEIDITRLLDADKLSRIQPVIAASGDASILAIKQQLGDDIGYGEIRLAMAWNNFQQGNQPGDEG